MRKTIATIDCEKTLCGRCELELPPGFCRAHNEYMDLDRKSKPVRLKACTDGEAIIAGIGRSRR